MLFTSALVTVQIFHIPEYNKVCFKKILTHNLNIFCLKENINKYSIHTYICKQYIEFEQKQSLNSSSPYHNIFFMF